MRKKEYASYAKEAQAMESESCHGWNIASAPHDLFELLGNLDELNSFLGIIICDLPVGKERELLNSIQEDLFLVQAEIGAPANTCYPDRVGRKHVLKLAEWSGEYDRMLTPIHHFVVPGGAKSAALLHYARTVARRVERSSIRYWRRYQNNPFIPPYLDRLSYVLFQMARTINQQSGFQEKSPTYGCRLSST